MKIMILILVSFATIGAFAGEVTRKYDDLLVKQTPIELKDILSATVVDSKEYAAYSIRLLVSGFSACGKTILADKGENTLAFYQIGKPGLYAQPGCSEVIEYFWTPTAYDIEEGKSKEVELKIESVNGQFISIFVDVTLHWGDFPNKKGSGRYNTYENIRIVKNIKNSPF